MSDKEAYNTTTSYAKFGTEIWTGKWISELI